MIKKKELKDAIGSTDIASILTDSVFTANIDKYNFKWIYMGEGDPGILVKTNIKDDTSTSHMMLFDIIGNSYSRGSSIRSQVQFYSYPNINNISNYSGVHLGYDFGKVKAFIYQGVICIWFNQTTNFQTFGIYARKTNNGMGINKTANANVVASIEKAAMPSQGVTKLVEINMVKG